MSSASSPRIWTVPMVIGLASIACLTIALLDDGIWDVIASAVLAAMLLFATYKGVTVKG